MKDFGTRLFIHREDGQSISTRDGELVKHAVCGMLPSSFDESSKYANIMPAFNRTKGPSGVTILRVILTRYTFGDDADAMTLAAKDELLTTDGPVAEQFAEELRKQLGPQFVIRVTCGEWEARSYG